MKETPRVFEGKELDPVMGGGGEPGLAMFFSFELCKHRSAPLSVFFLICKILEMPVRIFPILKRSVSTFCLVIFCTPAFSHSDLSLLC